MNYIASALLVVMSSCSVWLSAQGLPDNYVKDEDSATYKRFQQQSSTGFYGEDTVKTIALTFADTSWWSQIDDSVGYARLQYGELFLDSVAVSIKGSSSDFANNTLKKSFDLDFDAIDDDQEIEGYTRTNLHAGVFEPSNVRENIFAWIGGNYTPIAKSNYVHLTINGQNWGVYTNTQQLDRNFLEEWFVDPEGPRWRGESPFGRIGPDTSCVVPDQSDGRQATPSALHYLGPDSASYWQYYVEKGKHEAGDWFKLTNFIDKLNNIPDSSLTDSLDQYLDVDGALWFLAHEILLGDEDSYVFKTQSDYYLYHEPATNRMSPLEYDGNSSLEARSKTWSPLHRADDPCLPLLYRLLSVPEWRQRYLAHCRTIVEEYMHPDVVLPKVAFYADLIDPFELDDPIGDSLFTYSEFQSGINSVNSYVLDRYDFLSTHPLLSQQACTLSDQQATLGVAGDFKPTSNDSVFASVQISTFAASSVHLYYADGLGKSFETVEMFDDGLHGDGFANDNRYGAAIPPFPSQTTVVYYFEARTANVNKTASFLPKGAEHDVFTYQVEIDRVVDNPIRINELMASNDTTVTDETGEFDDWIELYNASDSTINLEGYALSDREMSLQKWTIDTSLVIPAKGYLILWCDEDGEDGPTHVNFKLSKGGEHVFLSNPQGGVIDEVLFGDQITDVSLAREVDGTGDFIQQVPTFGITNVLDTASSGGDTTMVSSTQQTSALPLEISLFPNPVSATAGFLNISGDARTELDINLYDALGRLVQRNVLRLDGFGFGRINLAVAHSGVYTARITTRDKLRVATKRLVIN